MEGILLSHGRNYFSQDRPLQLFLEHLGFRHRGSLDELGSYVSTRMMPEAYYIDRYARPSLIKWSVRGEELNEVLVSSGHLRTLYDC